ncbi:hypothetical protein [Veronia pacifica]|uniref:Uncharacterized protein n=1 Tax=Veronia pacifica TaxID=1080227 RepID=A0A1C3EI45_9GAMM|nr:hypothetical protein [Veronia pacifica]ODA32897.1 hypothetical protein A8L45_12220 [Veronia pacifica]
MKYFYERKEQENTVEIEIKTGAFYLLIVLIAGWVGLSFVSDSSEIGATVLPLIAAFVVVRFIALWKVQKEVLVAMSKKTLVTRGSKFSFANPLTYIIDKTEKE